MIAKLKAGIDADPKRLFLIDGLGAVTTGFFLIFVLGNFEGVFGMPRSVLFPLGGIAGVFAVYSFSSFVLVRDKWRPFLRLIAIANISYCLVTGVLLAKLAADISLWAFVYFFAEIVIVLALACIELSCCRKVNSNGTHQ